MARLLGEALVTWPERGAPNKRVVECKLRRARDGLEAVVRLGLEQTAAYMDRCEATEGHLVIFDRDSNRTWEEKIFHRPPPAEATPIHVWGM